MMKRVMTGLAVVVNFLAVAAGVSYGYDGDVFGGYDGNFTRYAFIQLASNPDLAREVLGDEEETGVRIHKLFSIGENDVDGEDVQMLNDLEGYIANEYQVGDGDAFSHCVTRSGTEDEADGWIVFSHYLRSGGWFHYLYYFLIGINNSEQ
jgi:hypothetical protein